jgi:uncharacterized protein involved in exopolysaccharide biosynthesis
MVRIVLLRLLESYFRHRWLHLVPLLVAVLAGGVSIAIATPEYTTGGQLFVEKESLLASLTASKNDGSLWVSAAQTTTTEIQELLGTQAFVRSAIQKTDLEANMAAGQAAIDKTMSYFRDSLSIQPAGDKLVSISAKSDDPRLAQQMVLATMDAYVQWKINTDYQESVAARTFFEGLIQPYTDQLDQARSNLLDYLDQYPAPVRGDRPAQEQIEVDRLQAELSQAEDRLKTAKDNEESARLALAKSESVTRQTYLVIDQPELPLKAETSLKSLLTTLGIFVALGVFLCFVGVGASALLDRSFRFPIDVRHGLSLPVLATVAVAPALSGLPRAAAVSADQPGDLATPGDASVLQPQL